MGQAKNKIGRIERMRKRQPFCVYCGGTTPIETIEHIPPISMFDHRFRPEGLEFGACYACNHNSRLDDMAQTADGVTGAFNAGGLLLNRAMERVGLRLGLALHYDQTGLIVPQDGGVLVRWYTNYQERIGQFPEDLLRRLGPLRTLKQGRRSAEGQFEFSSLSMPEGGMSAHLSRFRQAFVIVSLVTMDRGLLPDEGIARLMLPGTLRDERQ